MESYLSAEVQPVYSIAPANWAKEYLEPFNFLRIEQFMSENNIRNHLIMCKQNELWLV